MLFRRLSSRLIDWLLVLSLAWPLLDPFQRAGLVVAVAALYEALLVRWCGRTLGKALLGMAVVGPAAGLSFVPALARAALTTILPGAGCALVAAGVVWREPLPAIAGAVLLLLSVVECLDLRGTRTWHDRRAGTAVVRRLALSRR